MREFKKGDKVSWKTSQGRTEGTAVKRQTSSIKIKGHAVKASSSSPKYIVESAKSDKRAAHKPDPLREG